MLYCVTCRRERTTGIYCWHCGTHLQKGVIYCKQCKTSVEDNTDIFCRECGVLAATSFQFEGQLVA